MSGAAAFSESGHHIGALFGAGGAIVAFLTLGACTEPTEPVTSCDDASVAGVSFASPQSANDKLDEGPTKPTIAVSVVGAEGGTVSITAKTGVLAEPLMLTATGGRAGTKEWIPVVATPAVFDREPPVPLTLAPTIDGVPVNAIDLAPGERAVLYLVGRGFSQKGVYHAQLSVGGAQTQHYDVKIESVEPIGLRAATIALTLDQVSPFHKAPPFSQILPVDKVPSRPCRIKVMPAKSPSAGATALPVLGVCAAPDPANRAITISFPTLSPGRYEGSLEIEGEPLDVRITLKNPWWFVLVLVGIGGILSFGLRAFLGYRLARVKNEEQIVRVTRPVDRTPPPVAWDQLAFQNAVEKARGSNRVLALADVTELLQEAVVRDRPDLTKIREALVAPDLPEGLRRVIKRELSGIQRLSSRADADDIDNRLRVLAGRAGNGFRTDLHDWLVSLEKRIGGWPTTDPLVSLTSKDTRRVRAAVDLLQLLVTDGQKALLDSKQLRPEQCVILTWTEDVYNWLEEFRKAGDLSKILVQVRNILFCLTDEFSPDAAVPKPADPPPVADRRITVESGSGDAVRCGDEALISLTGGSVDWRARDFQWRVDGKVVLRRGGSRISYHIPGLPPWRRAFTVSCSASDPPGGPAIASQRAFPKSRPWDAASQERLWALVAQVLVTGLAVVVAGIATVAFVWADKPFGTWSDYMTPLSVGFGTDLTVVGAGGQLVKNVLESLKNSAERRTP